MKYRILSLTMVFLMVFSAAGIYAAADTYCNLGSVYTGTELNYSVAAVADGTVISCNDLPLGLRIDVYGNSIYLSGSINTAGNYMFTINTTDPMAGNISCTVNVMSMTPTLYTSGDVSCYVGEAALLSVSAGAADAGMLSYQWYYTASPGSVGGSALSGANGPELYADTSRVGTTYYYCVVGNGTGYITSNPICVTVMGVELQGIMVNTLPSNVVYEAGQLKDYTGLTITANYGQGNTKIISEGFKVTAGSYDRNTHTLMLTVEYEGKYCSFPLTVTEAEPQITGIGMVRLPNKQEYMIGESIVGEGLIFRAYYADGTYKDLSEDYSLAPNAFSAAGTQTVTLFYKENVCTFSVTVKAVADKLEIRSNPVKLSYNVGENIDTAGLVIRQTVNGVVTNISSGFSVEPSSFTQPGRQTVTVRYNGMSASYTVDVKAPAPATSAPAVQTPVASESPVKSGKSAELPSLTSPGKSNKVLIIVVLVIALLTLGAMGLYMLVVENGGIEELRYKLECYIYDLKGNGKRKK